MSKANKRQIGGSHYASTIQHWDYVLANRVPYLESMVIKYLTRWRDKNGYQDLDKAEHFMEKIMEQKGKHPDYTLVNTAEPQPHGYVDQDGPVLTSHDKSNILSNEEIQALREQTKQEARDLSLKFIGEDDDESIESEVWMVPTYYHRPERSEPVVFLPDHDVAVGLLEKEVLRLKLLREEYAREETLRRTREVTILNKMKEEYNRHFEKAAEELYYGEREHLDFDKLKEELNSISPAGGGE